MARPAGPAWLLKAGEALGDREMERKGQLDQMEGRAEQDLDRAERDLEDAAERKHAARRGRQD